MDGVVLSGLFALACTLQDVDPLVGTTVGEPHAMSYIARDGVGAMIGWTDVDGQEAISVSVTDGGLIRLTGAKFRVSSEPTWAELRPAGEDTLEIEWMFYDHPARDGRTSVSVWSKGSCTRLASQESGSAQ